MIYYLVVVYVALFLMTWTGTYAYFTNKFPTLDSYESRRENLAIALGFATFCPIMFFVIAFASGFFMYGFQFYGSPKKKGIQK